MSRYRYIPPTPDEAKTLFHKINMTGAAISREIGCSERTVRAWKNGEKPILFMSLYALVGRCLNLSCSMATWREDLACLIAPTEGGPSWERIPGRPPLTQHAIHNKVKFHQAWLDGKGFAERLDLSRHDVSGLCFEGLDMREALLRRANLTNCNLRDANLQGADLSDSCCTRANFRDADLRGADLARTDFTNADLTRTNLTHAQTEGIITARSDDMQKNPKLGDNLPITRQGETGNG